MADGPARNPDSRPPAVGPFDQIRCAHSRLLLIDGYRAALRAHQLTRGSIEPSNSNEQEN